jgi:hypothetical protein
VAAKPAAERLANFLDVIVPDAEATLSRYNKLRLRYAALCHEVRMFDLELYGLARLDRSIYS